MADHIDAQLLCARRRRILYLRSTTSKYFESHCVSYVGDVSPLIGDTPPGCRCSTSTVVDVSRVYVTSDCCGGFLRWGAIGFSPLGWISEFPMRLLPAHFYFLFGLGFLLRGVLSCVKWLSLRRNSRKGISEVQIHLMP